MFAVFIFRMLSRMNVAQQRVFGAAYLIGFRYLHKTPVLTDIRSLRSFLPGCEETVGFIRLLNAEPIFLR